MKKIIINLLGGLFIAAVIVGGLMSFNIIPKVRLDQFPEWLRIFLLSCFAIFSIFILLGYIFDSGIIQKIFKSKN